MKFECILSKNPHTEEETAVCPYCKIKMKFIKESPNRKIYRCAKCSFVKK